MTGKDIVLVILSHIFGDLIILHYLGFNVGEREG